VQKVRVQFDFHGTDSASCGLAHDAARAVLEMFSGKLPNQLQLGNAEYLQPISYFDNQPREFRRGCEFYLYFNQPILTT
jgi:hypothetical protein